MAGFEGRRFHHRRPKTKRATTNKTRPTDRLKSTLAGLQYGGAVASDTIARPRRAYGHTSSMAKSAGVNLRGRSLSGPRLGRFGLASVMPRVDPRVVRSSLSQRWPMSRERPLVSLTRRTVMAGTSRSASALVRPGPRVALRAPHRCE